MFKKYGHFKQHEFDTNSWGTDVYAVGKKRDNGYNCLVHIKFSKAIYVPRFTKARVLKIIYQDFKKEK